MNIFEIIYRWFAGMYGNNLADYLSGYNCETEAFDLSNLYLPLGIIALTIALVLMFVYYYVLNSARFNRWWHWVLALLIAGAFNLFIGHSWTSSDLDAGNIGECLTGVAAQATTDENTATDGTEIATSDDSGEEADDTSANTGVVMISEANCWLFGLADFFVAALFFIVLSFCFKWWSKQAKHSPF